jgi:hypothetical protein
MVRRLLRVRAMKILQLRLKDPEFDEDEEHDDELADFGGEADVALVALSIAAHVAAVALLHRSVRGMKNREVARDAARGIASRLSRRGEAPLGRRLAGALKALGTAKFDPVLREAIGIAARELKRAPLRQLEAIVGPVGAKELRGRSIFRAATLPPSDAEKVALLVVAGAELQVGLGKGAVLAPLIAPGTLELTLRARATEIRVSQLKPR